jgi:hypothetical protein
MVAMNRVAIDAWLYFSFDGNHEEIPPVPLGRESHEIALNATSLETTG